MRSFTPVRRMLPWRPIGQALAAAQQEKPAEGPAMAGWKDGLSQIYIGKGNALLRLKRNDEAIAAYNQSAVFAANQGLAYFNICAVLFNIGNTKDSAAACRKCVQADPPGRMPGSSSAQISLPICLLSLMARSRPRLRRREALEKYLTLAPDGPHAADVKAMLDMIAK